MRITEQGTFVVSSTQSQVIALITNPEFIGQTLPDSKGYRLTGPDTCVVEMKVGVSHLKGIMPTTLKILPYKDGEPLVIQVSAQGLGSRVDMELRFDTQGIDEKTQIDWTSDARVSGVLASVGSGLLRPLAKRNFDAIVAAIQEAIEAAI